MLRPAQQRGRKARNGVREPRPCVQCQAFFPHCTRCGRTSRSDRLDKSVHTLQCAKRCPAEHVAALTRRCAWVPCTSGVLRMTAPRWCTCQCRPLPRPAPQQGRAPGVGARCHAHPGAYYKHSRPGYPCESACVPGNTLAIQKTLQTLACAFVNAEPRERISHHRLGCNRVEKAIFICFWLAVHIFIAFIAIKLIALPLLSLKGRHPARGGHVVPGPITWIGLR